MEVIVHLKHQQTSTGLHSFMSWKIVFFFFQTRLLSYTFKSAFENSQKTKDLKTELKKPKIKGILTKSVITALLRAESYVGREEFIHLCGPWIFITMFTKACYWTLLRQLNVVRASYLFHHDPLYAYLCPLITTLQ
jgi:hypothetical protein